MKTIQFFIFEEKMNYNDIIGTIGVSIVLVAYFLNIFGMIPKEGILFFILNIIGATIACYASILINYKPFVILEGTWAFVSFLGLIKNLKK
ncbi:hypothetical protein [Flavobacterium sp.]|uniref:CBU_0592 family membrane protein n=1 Tax=Flavobacterium sp. TaxID=239 RepID=UPI00375058A0